ncbi:hypothetical protein AB0H49_29620 [Nocardia sp. NPDC050713]|uniref:hypothetical protein n=1 Tax=Nocardia sp. NPDC050713 TaxID=3154511 RepID=UPI0033D4E5BD
MTKKTNVVRGLLNGVHYEKGRTGAYGLEGANELLIDVGETTVVLEGSDAHELLFALQEILSASASDQSV